MKPLMVFFIERFHRLRLFIKTKFPLVKRKRLRRLERKYLAATHELTWQAPLAHEALLVVVKPVASRLTGEICLFVTFSPQPTLKSHVTAHIEHLLHVGVQVVLIVNSDNPQAPLPIKETLRARLTGIYIRENVGFDFAAWAHLLHVMPDSSGWTRMFFVNDSIAGPFQEESFRELMSRIRASNADFVGLTQNHDPAWHVQSFFMVFNKSAFDHPLFRRYFSRVASLSSKDAVIDIYETCLTQALMENGLSSEVLYPPMAGHRYRLNDTIRRWEQLLDAGFPYVKTSVIRQLKDDPRLRGRVPIQFLDC